MGFTGQDNSEEIVYRSILLPPVSSQYAVANDGDFPLLDLQLEITVLCSGDTILLGVFSPSTSQMQCSNHNIHLDTMTIWEANKQNAGL